MGGSGDTKAAGIISTRLVVTHHANTDVQSPCGRGGGVDETVSLRDPPDTSYTECDMNSSQVA